jgi:hypothetical protein
MADSKLTASEALAAADVAREAARLVSHGWFQEVGVRAGEVCAAIAVNEAAIALTGLGFTGPTCEHVNAEIYRRIGCECAEPGPGQIFKWNDAPERTQSDVVELFESIAKHFDREASKVER